MRNNHNLNYSIQFFHQEKVDRQKCTLVQYNAHRRRKIIYFDSVFEQVSAGIGSNPVKFLSTIINVEPNSIAEYLCVLSKGKKWMKEKMT